MSPGAWLRGVFIKLGQRLSQEDVQRRLSQVERAVELQYLGKPQAEADGQLGSAAAGLIDSLNGVPKAAIQIGSLLLLKTTDADGSVVMARTLTQSELIALEKKPELLATPDAVLSALADGCGED